MDTQDKTTKASAAPDKTTRDEWRLTTWPDGHRVEKRYVNGKYIGEWREVAPRVRSEAGE